MILCTSSSSSVAKILRYIFFPLVLLPLVFSASVFGSQFQFREQGFCSSEVEEVEEGSYLPPTKMATLGGVHDSQSSNQNPDEIDGLARFAVEQHNNKEIRLYPGLEKEPNPMMNNYAPQLLPSPKIAFVKEGIVE